MDAQLQQIIELQTKQNQLLERYLWRFRFSLWALLLLTTLVCCGLGVVIYTLKNTVYILPPSYMPAPSYAPTPQPAPAGSLPTPVGEPMQNIQPPVASPPAK